MPDTVPDATAGLSTVTRPWPGRCGASDCNHCSAREQSICNAIDDQDLHRLTASVVKMTVPAGCSFIEEDGPATDFFNITQGTVKLFKLLPDGRRQITGFAGVGDFIGLAGAATYAFGAEAIDPVQLCRFSRARLTRLMDDFPRLERRLLAEASTELVAAQNRMLLLGRKTARERVATFLIERQEQCGDDAVIALPMTRTDIGDYLGLTIETVSRTLSALRKAGLVVDEGTRAVRILSGARLERIAAGEAI